MLVAEVLKVPLGCCRGSRGTTTLVLSCRSFSDHSIHTVCHRTGGRLHCYTTWKHTCIQTHTHTRTYLEPYVHKHNVHTHTHTRGDPARNHLCPRSTLGCMLLVTLCPRSAVYQAPVFHHHLHSLHALSHRENEFHLGLWHLPPPSSTFNHISLSALQHSIALHHLTSYVV